MVAPAVTDFATLSPVHVIILAAEAGPKDRAKVAITDVAKKFFFIGFLPNAAELAAG